MRLAPLRALRGEVALGEEAAVLAGVARHLARGLALVEAGAARCGDALERAREVRIAEPLARGRAAGRRPGRCARRLGIGGQHVGAERSSSARAAA